MTVHGLLYLRSTGDALSCVTAQTQETLMAMETTLMGVVVIDSPLEPKAHYIRDGEVLPRLAKTSHHDRWTGSEWEDSRDLERLKTDARRELKKQRDAAEFGGFTWEGSTFDSDQISQSRIQGAAQLAQRALDQGQPFSIDWTLADNSARTLTAVEMLQVGTAMGMHIVTVHAQARAAKAQLELAGSRAEVETLLNPYVSQIPVTEV